MNLLVAVVFVAELLVTRITASSLTTRSSSGCLDDYDRCKDYGSNPQYIGYDKDPLLNITSCDMSIPADDYGLLSLDLIGIGIANYSKYRDINIDIVCVDSTNSTSSMSCSDCIRVSTDEEARSSYPTCNDCIRNNHSLYAHHLIRASDNEEIRRLNHSFQLLRQNDSHLTVQCYLQGCGVRSSCQFQKFKPSPITCELSMASSSISTPPSSQFTAHVNITTTTNNTTVFMTIGSTNPPHANSSSKVLNYSNGVDQQINSAGITTSGINSMVLSPSQYLQSGTADSSSPSTTYVSFTHSINSSSYYSKMSPTASQHAVTPSFPLELPLVIVAISLVFIVAAVVLVGFILIYRNWTNKLGNGNNKSVEDKHLEEAVHLRVGFESSKRDDTASVTSVVTLVQELCRPSAIITSETIIADKNPFTFIEKPLNEVERASSNYGSHFPVGPTSMDHLVLPTELPAVVIHALSSSPNYYTQRKITGTDNDYLSNNTEDISTPPPSNRVHSTPQQSATDTMELESITVDICTTEGNFTGAIDHCSHQDVSLHDDNGSIGPLSTLKQSISFDEYIDCVY